MSYRSRNYAADGVQFRGHVREVGEHMKQEWVWDETEAQAEARRDEARRNNTFYGDYRKGHYEDRGLQSYDRTGTFGPYSTIGPAKRAAGTGSDVRKVTTTWKDNGEWCTRTAEVHVGTVEWRLPQ